ncbi:MotE family protein [Geomesophilobacter sediminis]|uniref:Magnesium transporter MgtE intracellular domain-containing protein n=1 Tax=Geomesophilobacter sediminis TaxID=2798584 RepID=A0A8J7JCU9_9BACT|nr:hypothetical protein [Geomesophilobacter sediminis]MBJ6724748.1 hypothetical protein [Geomesophilobacter sediminis]
MNKLVLVLFLITAGFGIYEWRSPARDAGAAEPAKLAARARTLADDAAALDLKRQQLSEKEAALAAKEAELQRLSASLDARIKELDQAKKNLDTSLAGKKKLDEEKFKKTMTIYKKLKPADAAALMNKLDEPLVIEMLDKMDQKTAVKLIPFLTQPNVIRWTKENLASK